MIHAERLWVRSVEILWGILKQWVEIEERSAVDVAPEMLICAAHFSI
jgi:hypothetical protein